MQNEAATILDLLYVTNETLTAEEIAAATDLSLADVNRALTILEQFDHINIGIKADNQHFHDVTITENGVQAVEDQTYTDESHIAYDPVPGYWGTSREA